MPFRHRARSVDALRAGGRDPYPLGGGDPASTASGDRGPTDGSTDGRTGGPHDEVTVIGRVHRVRDHGSVLFVDLLDTPDHGGEPPQVLAEADRLGHAEWPLVVANNDLIGYAADHLGDADWPGEASRLGLTHGSYKPSRHAPMTAQLPYLTGGQWTGLDATSSYEPDGDHGTEPGGEP